MLSPKRFFENTRGRLDTGGNRRPREETKRIRKGLVIEVNEHYGRILCTRSFSDTGAYIFFDHNTTVNGTPLHLGNFDLRSAVPLGAEVDFKLTYGFPSKWRTFNASMGYFCEWLNFDSTKHVPLFDSELLVEHVRPNNFVTAVDSQDRAVFLHPHILPSHSVISKLYNGAEYEPRPNHRYQLIMQPGRTLSTVVRPVPNFLKNKLPRMPYICLSALPLSTSVVCYAYLATVGVNELIFDSVGYREEDDGDSMPLEIVMSRDMFLASVGLDKMHGIKINLTGVIGQPFQLGCVKNIQGHRIGLRAFCAYMCTAGRMPQHPRMQVPRDYIPGVKASAEPKTPEVKATPDAAGDRRGRPAYNSFTRRSFYHKFVVRRSFRTPNRKRPALQQFSPFMDFRSKKLQETGDGLDD